MSRAQHRRFAAAASAMPAGALLLIARFAKRNRRAPAILTTRPTVATAGRKNVHTGPYVACDEGGLQWSSGFMEEHMADNLSLIKTGYEAFAKGDMPTVLGLFDAKMEWYEPEHSIYWTGAPHVGPQSVLNHVFARLPKDFDGFHMDISRMVGSGDTVLVEGRFRGTGKATGKPLDAQFAHVWDLRDGKTVRFQQYGDTWQFAQVTGFTPRD